MLFVISDFWNEKCFWCLICFFFCDLYRYWLIWLEIFRIGRDFSCVFKDCDY